MTIGRVPPRLAPRSARRAGDDVARRRPRPPAPTPTQRLPRLRRGLRLFGRRQRALSTALAGASCIGAAPVLRARVRGRRESLPSARVARRRRRPAPISAGSRRVTCRRSDIDGVASSRRPSRAAPALGAGISNFDAQAFSAADTPRASCGGVVAPCSSTRTLARRSCWGDGRRDALHRGARVRASAGVALFERSPRGVAHAGRRRASLLAPRASATSTRSHRARETDELCERLEEPSVRGSGRRAASRRRRVVAGSGRRSARRVAYAQNRRGR